MNDMKNLTQDEIRYQQALKRVKRIKGFYTHAIVYVIINIAILFSKINLAAGHWNIGLMDFSTAFLWGVGLLAHGLSVFLPSFMMGKDWEARKIQELMDKEKKNKWE